MKLHRVVVIVDASNLSFGAHNDVWKGDREHIRNTIVGERYRELVTATIKDSAALKDLQQQVAQEEMERATKSERNDLFQKLVDADRNLAALLTERDPVIRLPAAGGDAGGMRGEGRFEGKYSPTFLQIESKSKKIELSINRRRPIAGRTDAENGYLDRADNCGRVLIPPKITERFAITHQLHDGRLTVYLNPVDGKNKIGERLTFKIGLQDPAMPAAVDDELTIVIVGEEHLPPPKSKNKTETPKKEQSGNAKNKEAQGDSAPTHGLPRHILLTSDGRNVGSDESEQWPEGFTEHDGGTIRDLGDNNLVYCINYDNAYHIQYRRQQRGEIAREVVTEKYILGMRILMLGFEHAVRTMLKNNTQGISEFLDEYRRMAARGAASTVLALAENLPRIIDTSSVGDEAE